MQIRFAQVRDIPGMIGLLRQVGQVHHHIRPDLFRGNAQKYNETDLEALLADPTRPIFVAVEDDRLLGYCFCVLEETAGNPVLMDDKSLYIDDLCVDEQLRGRHVGSALYDYVKAYAKDIGCRGITLNVWCGNDSAQRFYEKQGLTPRKIFMEQLL